MKQVLQHVRAKAPKLLDVPPPQCGKGEVLVATEASLISAGTEKMLLDFAGKSLLGKAKARPDLAQKVLSKLQRDGLVPTAKSVLAQLEQPLPLGYSAVGRVLEVGSQLTAQFQVGQRVVMAGAGIANHAQVNAVPKNLLAHAPTGADATALSFCTLGAIALHGVRNAGLTLGDRVIVLGLGLVGQLAAQLATLSGARVLGVDYTADRCDTAKATGACAHVVNPAAADVAAAVHAFTNGRGADAILICAATDSQEPIQNAAAWSRDRGTIILVGKVGTELPYADFMKKELTVRISRSYGPGRYDDAFERQGQRYPVGYVPWTEQDNLQEIATLIGDGRLQVNPLISHTFSITEAEQAYALITSDTPCLGVVLTYPSYQPEPTRMQLQPTPHGASKVGVAALGAGAFARSVLLPALQASPQAILTGICSKSGTSAQAAGQRFGFSYATSDWQDILQDSATHAVIISTQHNTHAQFVQAALRAGKHVFVEKPLALTLADIDAIERTWRQHPHCLMVGYNRRFAPMTQALLRHLPTGEPRQILIRVNAGHLPQDNWQTDPHLGGGRLLGEVCHFTDLALYLAQAMPTEITALQGHGQDNYSITLKFAEGSLAQIFYTSDGDTAASKERVEVYAGESVGVIDNFLGATFTSGGKTKRLAQANLLTGQNKGHSTELQAFLAGCQSGQLPIPLPELLLSAKVPLWCQEAIQSQDVLQLQL